jgi:septal ring factor EnvC (AmiA/AmiB activator)
LADADNFKFADALKGNLKEGQCIPVVVKSSCACTVGPLKRWPMPWASGTCTEAVNTHPCKCETESLEVTDCKDSDAVTVPGGGQDFIEGQATTAKPGSVEGPASGGNIQDAGDSDVFAEIGANMRVLQPSDEEQIDDETAAKMTDFLDVFSDDAYATPEAPAHLGDGPFKTMTVTWVGCLGKCQGVESQCAWQCSCSKEQKGCNSENKCDRYEWEEQSKVCKLFQSETAIKKRICGSDDITKMAIHLEEHDQSNTKDVVSAIQSVNWDVILQHVDMRLSEMTGSVSEKEAALTKKKADLAKLRADHASKEKKDASQLTKPMRKALAAAKVTDVAKFTAGVCVEAALEGFDKATMLTTLGEEVAKLPDVMGGGSFEKEDVMQTCEQLLPPGLSKDNKESYCPEICNHFMEKISEITHGNSKFVGAEDKITKLAAAIQKMEDDINMVKADLESCEQDKTTFEEHMVEMKANKKKMKDLDRNKKRNSRTVDKMVKTSDAADASADAMAIESANAQELVRKALANEKELNDKLNELQEKAKKVKTDLAKEKEDLEAAKDTVEKTNKAVQAVDGFKLVLGDMLLAWNAFFNKAVAKPIQVVRDVYPAVTDGELPETKEADMAPLAKASMEMANFCGSSANIEALTLKNLELKELPLICADSLKKPKELTASVDNNVRASVVAMGHAVDELDKKMVSLEGFEGQSGEVANAWPSDIEGFTPNVSKFFGNGVVSGTQPKNNFYMDYLRGWKPIWVSKDAAVKVVGSEGGKPDEVEGKYARMAAALNVAFAGAQNAEKLAVESVKKVEKDLADVEKLVGEAIALVQAAKAHLTAKSADLDKALAELKKLQAEAKAAKAKLEANRATLEKTLAALAEAQKNYIDTHTAKVAGVKDQTFGWRKGQTSQE